MHLFTAQTSSHRVLLFYFIPSLCTHQANAIAVDVRAAVQHFNCDEKPHLSDGKAASCRGFFWLVGIRLQRPHTVLLSDSMKNRAFNQILLFVKGFLNGSTHGYFKIEKSFRCSCIIVRHHSAYGVRTWPSVNITSHCMAMPYAKHLGSAKDTTKTMVFPRRCKQKAKYAEFFFRFSFFFLRRGVQTALEFVVLMELWRWA